MFNIILLGLTSLFTDIASEMVYPLIPFFLTVRLGASPAVLGLIEGLAESVASLLKVFSGRLSDYLQERKKLTIAGYTCSAFGKLLLALAAGWGMVLGGGVVDRVGKGIRTAPRDALVADSAGDGRHGRAFGLHRALDSFGAVIGVTLGYLFFTRYTGDYTLVFLWSLVPAVIAVALLLFVREPKKHAASAAASGTSAGARCRAGCVGSSRHLPVHARQLVEHLPPAARRGSRLHAGERDPALPGLQRRLRAGVVPGRLAVGPHRPQDPAGQRLPVLRRRVPRLCPLHPSHHVLLWGLFGLYGLYMGVTEGVEKALVADLDAGFAARHRHRAARHSRRRRPFPGLSTRRAALGARRPHGGLLLRRRHGPARALGLLLHSEPVYSPET